MSVFEYDGPGSCSPADTCGPVSKGDVVSGLDHHPIDCGPEGCPGCIPEGFERCEDCGGRGQDVSGAGVIDYCSTCDGNGYEER